MYSKDLLIHITFCCFGDPQFYVVTFVLCDSPYLFCSIRICIHERFANNNPLARLNLEAFRVERDHNIGHTIGNFCDEQGEALEN